MPQRLRVGLTLPNREHVLLALAAGLQGVPPTTFATTVARREIADAERILGGLGEHPADPRTPAAKDAAALWKRLNEQLEEHDQALARADDLALPAKARRAAKAAASGLAEASDQLTGELLDALRAVEQAREQHDRAADADVDREIAELYVAGINEQLAGLKLVASGDTRVASALERGERRHGRDRGSLAPDARFPFPGLPDEHVARLAAILAPVAARNGHVLLRLIGFPAQLKGRDRKRFSDLVESAPPPDRGALRSWPYSRFERVGFTEPVARGLVALRLAERVSTTASTTPAAPTAGRRVLLVRLLKQIGLNNIGEEIGLTLEQAEDFVSRGWAELTDPAAPTTTPAPPTLEPVLILAAGSGLGLMRGDVAYFPPERAAELIRVQAAREPTAAELKAGRVALGEPAASPGPKVPLDWGSYTPHEPILVTVLTPFGPYRVGEQIGLDRELADHLAGLDWITLTPPAPTKKKED